MHKTAYEMRISDWSSDVCSSDLAPNIRGLMPSELACGALGSVAGTTADALNEVTTYLLLNRLFLSPAHARCWVIDNRKAGIANTPTASQKGQRTMIAPRKRTPACTNEPRSEDRQGRKGE